MASIAVFLVLFTLVHNSWEQTEETTCSSARPMPAEQTQYALMLSSYEYFPGQAISVKVYLRYCPTIHTLSPSWYKLEAISEQDIPVGTFDEPGWRIEAHTSDDRTAIIFETCEPEVMDLPKVYSWNAPSVDVGIVYFRLTVKDPEAGCLVIETPNIEPDVASGSSSGHSDYEDYEHYEEDYEAEEEDEEGTETNGIVQRSASQNQGETNRERCERRWNCTDAHLRDLCGSDGNTYASRCHKRLQECITGQTIGINYTRPCGPTTPTPLPPCHSLRKTLIEYYGEPDWLPMCDCNGYFKPVQCMFKDNGALECYCSTEIGGEVPSSRRELRCIDPETFEYNCQML